MRGDIAMDVSGETFLDPEDDSGIDSNGPEPTENGVYIRVAVSDLKVQKCLQFHLDDLVWVAKQRVINTLAKDIRDGLNYGLYCPPMNGRAGKFLDEERPLRDYPLPGPIGFLEFKYKRRVYKQMQINPRKLKQLHTKANMRQFADSVKSNNVEKVTKFTNRGLDPNFHDNDSKETPLGLACKLEKSRPMCIALVSGGAHIDFRNREGLTAMHTAAAHGNLEAIKALLDLGSSPNYKDARGLTPLYHCILHDTNAHCVEALLHDHSVVGITDERGWCEIHQACKDGRVQHLEHLLFYGADMNCQNTGGNTALHICSLHNQESCARVLLFRGIDKSIQNFGNQDAFQIAVISGNTELAEIIKDFREEEVVPFQEVPKYNEKRRGVLPGMFALQRSRSDPRLNLAAFSDGSSPSLSNNSYPHYASNSALFDSPGGSAGQYRPHYDSDSPRSMSISSAGSVSGFSGRESVRQHENGLDDSVQYACTRQRLYAATPGRRFVCTKPFTPTQPGELQLRKGQIIQVLSIGEGGFWEGSTGVREGWFPSEHVEEVRLRRCPGSRSVAGDDEVLVKRRTLAQLTQSSGENAPRTVVLQKGNSGFGFVLRGAKAQAGPSSQLEFTPTTDFPALQYLDRVDRNSPADRAGLKPGDFLLEINSEVVVNATHEHTVRLIKNSGETLAMKVVTIKPLPTPAQPTVDIHQDGTRTLPLRKKGAATSPQNPYPTITHRATIRDSLAELEKLDLTLAAYDGDQIDAGAEHDINYYASLRGVDPNNKTASIRSRPNSQRMSAIEMESLMRSVSHEGVVDTERSASRQVQKPVVNGARVYSSVANMKARRDTRSGGSLSRATSTPNLAPNDVMCVDMGDPTMQYNRVNHHYAVPDRVPSQNAAVIHGTLPRSRHAAPRSPPPMVPPNGEVVRIKTGGSPGYANVADQIRARHKSGVESSFIPGANASLSKEPLLVPSNYRVGENRPREPEPDYDEPAVKVESPPVTSLRANLAHKQAQSPKTFTHSPRAHSKSSPNTPSPGVSHRQLSAPAPTPPPPPPAPAPPPLPPPNMNTQTNNTVTKSHTAGTKKPALIPERGNGHAALMAAINNRRTSTSTASPAQSQSRGRAPPPPKSAPPTPSTDNGDASPNFLALAEKRRLEYLQRKSALDRRKNSPSPHSTPSPPPPPPKDIPAPPPPPNFSEGETRTPPHPDVCSPKAPAPPTPSDNTDNGSPGIGGIAALIAQRALARQKTIEGTVDTNGNQVGKTASYSKVYRTGGQVSNGSNTNGSNRLATSRSPEIPIPSSSLNIMGATVDSSNTEHSPRTVPSNRHNEAKFDTNADNMSVADRMKMFELQGKGSVGRRGPAVPVRASSSRPLHSNGDCPPPMVPPPPPMDQDFISNGHHNWDSQNSPDMLIQSKVAHMNGSHHRGGVDASGGVGVMVADPMLAAEDISMDLFVCPPPPLFDSEVGTPPGEFASRVIAEDNASLVSELSSLSTLSSNEQEAADSSGYASAGRQQRAYNLSQAEEFTIVPPPPPLDFNDDGGLCIPPPMDFSASPSRPITTTTTTSSSTGFQNNPIERWSCDDVGNWLRSIGLGAYSHPFTSRRVSGQQLVSMSRTDLVAMGMTQVGHRMQLERAINMAKITSES